MGPPNDSIHVMFCGFHSRFRQNTEVGSVKGNESPRGILIAQKMLSIFLYLFVVNKIQKYIDLVSGSRKRGPVIGIHM